MTKINSVQLLGAMAAILGMGACATAAPFTSGRLANSSETTITSVRNALRAATGKPQLQLGVSNYATSTTIIALPSPSSPIETRNVAMPTTYNIMTNGVQCQLVNATSGQVIKLSGIACVKVGAN